MFYKRKKAPKKKEGQYNLGKLVMMDIILPQDWKSICIWLYKKQKLKLSTRVKLLFY